MISLLERYGGALVGVLVGDALGAPYETWDSARIHVDFGARGGLVPFDYDDPWGKDGRFPAGRPTDDSELTAALGVSLAETDGEEGDLYRRFRECVIERKSMLCALPAYGFGGTTRESLRALTYEEAQKLGPLKNPIPTNGALMRTAPVTLRYHTDLATIVAAARRASILTHTHPLAVECTIFYSIVLDGVLTGMRLEEAFEVAVVDFRDEITQSELRILLENPLGNPFERPEPQERNRWGAALHSLRVALWAAHSSRNFRDGITRAVGFGGDTDTYAAIAGALLGARYGIDEIPPEWRSATSGKGYEKMLDISYDLWTVWKRNYAR